LRRFQKFERCFIVPQIKQLAAAIVAGIADPNFKAWLLTLGVKANPFGQFIADEIREVAESDKIANIKPE
jgi:hypothetical protein